MPYATIEDLEALIGFDLDNTGNTRPTQNRAEKMLFRADDIMNGEMHVDDNILVERSKITCSAKTDIDAADYFYFYITDTNGGEAKHYIWYDVNDGDSDPDKEGTGHEVDISGVTTAREVATETASIIDAIDKIRAWSKGEYLYIENFEMFNATDVEDGNTDFTFEVLQDGQDDSGGLKNICLELVQIMINNMYAFTNPEKYAFKKVELSKDHIRTIHKTYYKWEAETFELGD